ncbi:MAG: 2-C-methyl-D-erythritol 4-phosphate cytidylyltransferase [Gemmatimonadota bacterium]|nr:2-C-methyl-D-erythritol 4-phosphate cytidylyltransferase [Gemmatimonadota bacterium]
MTEGRDPVDDAVAGVRLRVGVAVPAAGSGRRMGNVKKAFLELAGEPVLLRALRPFLADGRVARVVVALAPDDAAAPPEWLTGADPRVEIVRGGATRGASVAACLEALPEDVQIIAVHDAARPLVPASVVRRCIDVAASGVGAVAGCPVVDTMKVVDREAFVRSTPERSTLWHAHTPQVFPAEALRRAYATSDESATDDASLVEAQGLRIQMVDDGALNPKITRPGDVALGEAILAASGGPS